MPYIVAEDDDNDAVRELERCNENVSGIGECTVYTCASAREEGQEQKKNFACV